MSDGEITADEIPLCRELTVVDNTVSTMPNKTAPFELPEGWILNKVPRPDGIREDHYFYEPGTGKKFYSWRAVERHLKGVEETPKQDSCFEKFYQRRVRKKVIPLIADERYFPGPDHKSSPKSLKKGSKAKSPLVRRSIVPCGKSAKSDNNKLAVISTTEAAGSPFNLPDGWTIQAVRRKYKKHTDKTYFEPGTGRRFTSLIAVKRHLEESNEDKPLAVMFNLGTPTKEPNFKKTSSEKKSTSPTFGPATPPDRIKWVLTDDSEGSTFKPFIGESMVADPVVQRWTKRFKILINGENSTAPSF